MKDLKTKIEEIRDELIEETTYRAFKSPHKNYDKAVWEFPDKIIALFLSEVEGLIGEDEPSVPIEPRQTFTQRIAKAQYQNDLRAEQRKKLGEIK